jgi:4-O-beta-D-mannosyl-D-glucose phosphorylase
MQTRFEKRLQSLQSSHKELIGRTNKILDSENGIFNRYMHPVLTAQHTPVFWRYDLNYQTNPFLMERFGISAVKNAGAIKLNGKYLLIARVEGTDSKSFLAVAESINGVDNFEFWDYPVSIPEFGEPDFNIYDMRLVTHEDGWLYGIFCSERRDPDARLVDQSATIDRCGIARTVDLKRWERLPDLKTSSPQQWNVVLHPEFVDGKYAFYTRPQDNFTEAGGGSGIGFGLSDSIENASTKEEVILDQKQYHTGYEINNGRGPAPIKTQYGWLHLAHGVRNAAAGLRYVLYLFMTDLKDLTSVIYKPGGYFITAEGYERAGLLSNVSFCNGWIVSEDGLVYIYFASSDTRLQVATTSLDQLLDYVMNTEPAGLSEAKSINTLSRIIDNNKALMQLKQSPKEKSIRG